MYFDVFEQFIVIQLYIEVPLCCSIINFLEAGIIVFVSLLKIYMLDLYSFFYLLANGAVMYNVGYSPIMYFDSFVVITNLNIPHVFTLHVSTLVLTCIL